MTRLALFLCDIEPIPDRIGRLVDHAVNTFEWRSARFDSADQYTAWLSALYCRLECAVLGIPERPVHPDLDCSRAFILLRKKYGDNVAQTLFDIARSGSEGGIRQITRTMADIYGREYAKNLIKTAVFFYIQNRSPAAIIEDAQEYIERYADIVPAEMAEGMPARMSANFRKVLEMHPFVMQRIRQTGR